MKIPRIRLKQDEFEIIEQYRAIKQESNQMGLNDADVKHGWLKSKKASLFFKNPNFKEQEEQNYEKIRASILDEIRVYAPKYPTITRTQSKDGHLLVIDPADIHIGKLCDAFETGEDYNSQIAVQRVLEGVQGILDKSAGFHIDKILFVGGNDILHIDTPRRTTTSGTPQDTDGMWYRNFLTAKQLYVDLLEKLIALADVHFVFNPSNHDYTHGFFLADTIKTHFRQATNITFDCSLSHRKAFRYGENLIGTTHGDGAKHGDLPLLLATEFPMDWSLTKHRYVYMHHVHHKMSKDYQGVTVESLRSASGTDSWHHRNGYQYAPKAIEGFLHHKKHGQIARLSHIF